LQSPLLVKVGTFFLNIALTLRLPVTAIIKATIFRQFCGGEDLESCNSTIEKLAQFNVGTILDYSVEGSETDAALDRTTEELLRAVNKSEGNLKIPFCVFKMSGIARFELLAKVNLGSPLSVDENIEFDRVKSRLEKICERAFAAEVRIFVDAEESWIQSAIDSLAWEMMARFNQKTAIVYNTFQMYRQDKLADLDRWIERARQNGIYLGVKIVRGAYMEKERERSAAGTSLIFPDKDGTDCSYNEALKLCLKNIDCVALCAGTHNEFSTELLTTLMRDVQLPANSPRVYFSQLLGMSENLSFNLAHEGYRVAKYVPYGPVRAVIPYLVRRAEENTSIQGQTGRELALITEERTRRALAKSSP
jgi:proline dehydrogenase